MRANKMSTRAIINFTANEGNSLSVYVHGDGGPRWLGKQLAEILANMEIGNGTRYDIAEYGKYASTSDDAILQIISLIKGDRHGYVYLTAPGQDRKTDDLWDIDYIYNVHFQSTNLNNYKVFVGCAEMEKTVSKGAETFLDRVNYWIRSDDLESAAYFASLEKAGA